MHETETTIDPKRRYLCRHVFTEGHRCGSPSLRGKDLCYYHGRSRREAGISGRSGTFAMPRIDDRATIQLALYEVLSRLAGGDIEFKRGSVLLYGLQIASANLPRHPQPNAEKQPQVEEVAYDYVLGDLAPIAEIPTPVQTPDASLTDTPPDLLVEDHDAKLADAPPQESVILSEEPQRSEGAQSKDPEADPEAAQIPKECAAFRPPQPASSPAITLAAVHACANPQLNTPEPPTVPSPSLPHTTSYNGHNDSAWSGLPTRPCASPVSG